MANKYVFASIEHWALSLLNRHRNTLFNSCPLQTLELLLRLAAIYAQSAWLDRLQDEGYNVNQALDFAERHDYREFAGQLYYEELLRMSAKATENPDPAVFILGDTRHSMKRRICFLQGYWSLSSLWRRIRKQMLVFGYHTDSTSDKKQRKACEREWRHWSKVAFRVARSNSVDEESTIEKRYRIDKMNMSCCAECKEQLKDMWAYFRDGIAEYFLGPCVVLFRYRCPRSPIL
ncbi:hypothetical protein BDQ17DRAFT_1342798 [Cyathus striatus]|nr:hypothetical protein BDQ17DRAFT_1342798 [Cyathus striatus]